MTAQNVSKRWLVIAAAVLILLACAYSALAQLPRFSSYRRHQIGHVLAAANVHDERDLLGKDATAPTWRFDLSDDDPFVCEVNLSWKDGSAERTARWVVIHRLGTRGVQLDEVAALNSDARRLTPRIPARESLRGNL